MNPRLVQSEWGERDHILLDGWTLCGVTADHWYPPAAAIEKLCSNCKLASEARGIKASQLYVSEQPAMMLARGEHHLQG